MPSEQPKPTAIPTLNAQTENPLHYTYLKEFRVEPCPLFKQHQCQQHRPYTCFHWHFANQRRRRPIRRRDGTFNYSPDVYCSSYDENSGTCADGGDECVFLHRVAGDVERKYHLRYYKTAMCVYPTDAKGQCVKNGIHCAFAHNGDDLRQPIYDIRELQQFQANSEQSVEKTAALLENKEKTSFVVEDPIWLDQDHVLSCYKTESCKKPPRLCRQGYACPFYHNGKDKRRPPGVFKYRSTPCPSAKSADEWADPDSCETGDPCPYCHTRTEQQFHPEIFKSTKCNDMLQHGYCPRGPFCAFAHTDQEMHTERPLKVPPTAVESAAAAEAARAAANDDATATQTGGGALAAKIDIPEAPYPPTADAVMRSLSENGPAAVSFAAPTYSAVLKQRNQSGGKGPIGNNSRSTSIGGAGLLSSSYPKAPGFERSVQSPTRAWTPDCVEGGAGSVAGRMRTTSLTMHPSHNIDLGFGVGYSYVGAGGGGGSADGLAATHFGTPPTPNGGNLKAAPPTGFLPFAQNNKTALSQQKDYGVGGVSMDDLSLDEMTLLAPIAEREEGSSLPSQFGEDITAALAFSKNLTNMYGGGGGTAPMTIPGAPSADELAGGQFVLGRSNSGGGDDQFRMSAGGTSFAHPTTAGSLGRVPLAVGSYGGLDNGVLATELQRTKEELSRHRAKLTAWEDGLKQARQACEAWKKEAEAHRQIAASTQAEKQSLQNERDTALAQLETIKMEMVRLQQHQMNSQNTAVGSPNMRLDKTLSNGLMQASTASGVNGPMCGRCGRQPNNGGASGNGGCPVCSSVKS